MSNEKATEKFITSVAVRDLLVSAGVQLIHWAKDIAFTDAAYGQEWALEAANRMATLSEVLNILYKQLDVQALEQVIELPASIVGIRIPNPSYVPEAEEPSPKGEGSTERKSRGKNIIDDFPF